MTFKKNEKVKIARRLDMSATGGPIIPKGARGKVVIRRRDGRLWVDIEGYGPRHLCSDDLAKK